MKSIKRRYYGIIRGITVGIAFALQIVTFVVLALFLRKAFFAFYLFFELISVLTVFAMVNDEEPYRNSWILIILLLPVTGIFLYFMWGRKRINSREYKRFRILEKEIKELMKTDETQMREFQTAHPDKMQICQYLSNEGFPVYRNTKVEYYPTGEKTFEKMFQDIKNAKKFIFLEYFIVSDGKLWQELLEILTQKVKEGVEVKLLFDDFGALLINTKEFRDDLVTRGIDISIFNPIHKGVARLSFNYRNHQKITIVDGNIGYTGGINLADEYANYIERFGYWKDSGIRLAGEAVWSLTCNFIKMWRIINPVDFIASDLYRPSVKIEDSCFVQPFAGGPHKNPNNPIAGAYTRMIYKACDYIYITTPYLVLDQNMRIDLIDAARSGIDVKIIVPAIYDKWVVYMVNILNYGKLMEAGVHIYEYQPGFIHAKNVISDDVCAICGTINVDYRSFYHHYECGALISDTIAIKEMKRDFEQTLTECREITLDEWKKRPLSQKVIQSVLKLLSPML